MKPKKNAPERKPRIYIAAPYSRGIPDEVIVRVVDAAEQLAARGWAPFIPHTMTFLWAVRHQHPVAYWYAFDNEWITACDAIVRLPGPSTGADAEVALAARNGLLVYDGENALADACRDGARCEPDACPRCARNVLRPFQGEPSTPLCDACISLVGPRARGWWAGFTGWGRHNSEDGERERDYYDTGFAAGIAARTASGFPPEDRQVQQQPPTATSEPQEVARHG